MLDLRSPPADFYANPYPYYDELRSQGAISAQPDGSLFVASHAACTAIYQHPSAFSSDKQALFAPRFGVSPLLEHHTTSLVFSDPPYHTRVRQTLVEALKPRRVQATMALLAPYVQELLTELRERGEFDAIADFAARIPVLVICRLLGVPRSDESQLRDWSLAILGALEASITAQTQARGDAAVTDFLAYLRRFIDDCGAGRQTPGDVLAALLAQQRAGDICERELLHNCIFLLNAGHETTTNLIGSGIHMLLVHPEAASALRAAQGQRVSVAAVEEVLRYQSPNQLGNREVVEPIEIAGCALVPGDQLTLGIGAANRDPGVFVEPHRFDIARSPNPHLAFASGAHACAGMALARVEGRIALAGFVRALPAVRMVEEPAYQPRARFRGLTRLQLQVA